MGEAGSDGAKNVVAVDAMEAVRSKLEARESVREKSDPRLDPRAPPPSWNPRSDARESVRSKSDPRLDPTQSVSGPRRDPRESEREKSESRRLRCGGSSHAGQGNDPADPVLKESSQAGEESDPVDLEKRESGRGWSRMVKERDSDWGGAGSDGSEAQRVTRGSEAQRAKSGMVTRSVMQSPS